MFHYFHHPFCGFSPYFWKHPYEHVKSQSLNYHPTLSYFHSAWCCWVLEKSKKCCVHVTPVKTDGWNSKPWTWMENDLPFSRGSCICFMFLFCLGSHPCVCHSQPYHNPKIHRKKHINLNQQTSEKSQQYEENMQRPLLFSTFRDFSGMFGVHFENIPLKGPNPRISGMIFRSDIPAPQ